MLVKILSYNIHGLPFLSENYITPFIRWLNNYDSDFICLQEVFSKGRINILTSTLTKNGFSVIKPDDTINTNILSSGLLTAYKTDRWIKQEEGFNNFINQVGLECLTNKGFHWLKFKHIALDKHIILINTHLQANNPVNYLFGCIDAGPVRQKQVIQIIDLFKNRENVFIVGDINSENSPNDEIKYLTGSKYNIKKHTFPLTGEDLDHVAILSKTWVTEPIILSLSVLSRISCSDHWPLEVLLNVF